eukprot:2160493-Amphidinium_carterae.1
MPAHGKAELAQSSSAATLPGKCSDDIATLRAQYAGASHVEGALRPSGAPPDTLVRCVQREDVSVACWQRFILKHREGCNAGHFPL